MSLWFYISTLVLYLQESELSKIKAPLYIPPLLIKTIALMNFKQFI